MVNPTFAGRKNTAGPGRWAAPLALLLAALLGLGSLAGCNGSQPDSGDPPLSGTGNTTLGEGPEPLMAAALEMVAIHFNDRMAEGTMLDYQVETLDFVAGGDREFCVAITYSYTEETPAPNANGTNRVTSDGTSRWDDCYLELRIGATADGGWRILDTGTGGGAQGLARPGAPTAQEVEGYIAYLLGRVQDAYYVSMGEMLPVVEGSGTDQYFYRIDQDPADPTGAYQQVLHILQNLRTVADVKGYITAPFTKEAGEDLLTYAFNDRYQLYRETDGNLYVNRGITPQQNLGGQCELDTLEIIEITEDLVRFTITKTQYQPEVWQMNLRREGGLWVFDETYYRRAA